MGYRIGQRVEFRSQRSGREGKGEIIGIVNGLPGYIRNHLIVLDDPLSFGGNILYDTRMLTMDYIRVYGADSKHIGKMGIELFSNEMFDIILGEGKNRDGIMRCKDCNEINEYAIANDGELYRCYRCRN